MCTCTGWWVTCTPIRSLFFCHFAIKRFKNANLAKNIISVEASTCKWLLESARLLSKRTLGLIRELPAQRWEELGSRSPQAIHGERARCVQKDDNYSANKALENHMGVHLVWLWAIDPRGKHPMVQLRRPNISSKLYKALRRVNRIKTPWSSRHDVIQRYLMIRSGP